MNIDFADYICKSPSCPANWPDDNSTYEVRREAPRTSFLARAVEPLIASFDNEDEAVAFVGNLETHKGEVIDLIKIDHRTQDEEVLLCGQWDEVLSRYLS